MNKYQLLKYAIIGLTFTSRAASTAIFLKPELRTFTPYLEPPTKQVLIQGGNSLWNYELSQQTLPNFTCQTDHEWISIERSIK